MGKGAILALGTAGVGGLGIGGLVVFKPWQSTSKRGSKISPSIKEKHPVALLDTNGDNSIWEKKYTVLKTSSPNNSLLKEALKNSKASNEKALRLLKEGCLKIYESKIDDTESFSDFKALCSRNNEDASKTNSWNVDTSTSDNNKWDKALTKLSTYNKRLDTSLSTLKEEIRSPQTTTFNSSVRTKIIEWCSQAKGSMFEGEDSIKFENQEEFCKVINP